MADDYNSICILYPVYQPWRLLTPHVRLDIKVARLQQGFKSEVMSSVEVYGLHFNVREMLSVHAMSLLNQTCS